MSNGLSCRSIVVVVEFKAAPVALLPLALQISHLIDSLRISIMVESFCVAIRAARKIGFVKYGSSANEDAPIFDVIEAKSLISSRLSKINHSLGFRG